jgi:hypothetical protein
MIERLTKKNIIDIITFLLDNKDYCEDFYFTIDKERLFLKNNQSLTKKILEKQECYGYFNNGLKGILIIYKSKGFRPYLKMLAVDYNATSNLMKFFVWNKNEIDIFCKLKINNPIINVIKRFGFFVKANRGKEVLFFKQGFKTLNKLVPKDDYLPKEEKRLY